MQITYRMMHPSRLAELEEKTPDVTRTDIRKTLRDEIAIYDGSVIIQKIREGKNIVLDSSGRPDIRTGIYQLLKDNDLFEQSDFSSYNMSSPSPEALNHTAWKRLEKRGNVYTADEIEGNYPLLFPAPICGKSINAFDIPNTKLGATVEDAKETLRTCQETEKALFKNGRMKAYQITRKEKDTDGKYPLPDITEIYHEDIKMIEAQHALVCNGTALEENKNIGQLTKEAESLTDPIKARIISNDGRACEGR